MVIHKSVFIRNWSRFFFYFLKYHMKILLGNLMQKGTDRIFSNRQMGMRVYIRIKMIMVLE